ncbi:hypothetical protein PYW08_006092 [Mythimna loreyi]|uniref:Uncharacterized protein n=2 Tax=Mythimna loreyi TaxID=667449 RepID=A0ACC2QLP2_9NEOP|nr:hypothetical protein PYW08_006092 [Mythimna loreyi]
MASPMNKSPSESEIDQMSTPPNYVSHRSKRSWEDILIAEKLDDFKKEIKDMMAVFMSTQERELQKVSLTLKDIQESNINIQDTIKLLSSQNLDLEKKISQMEIQVKEDKKYITTLEHKIEDLETGCRKSNFVIKNVPKITGESKQDLIDMVMSLSQNIDCSMVKNDIKDIYRVRGNKQNFNTPIVVETGSTLLKNNILRMAKNFNIKYKTKLCCKHLGFKTHEDSPIFLSEHLTAKGSRLYFLARDLKRSGAYKYCWTAYGKVLVKKDDQAPSLIISSEAQIQQLMQEV